ncbi:MULTISPECIES: cupin [Campylobacter]|uniref:cupin n=1 Tax=Campylobacter TaxID=194 RepID=UPI000A343D48|nr:MULTISPECIES: cupin [unclassified Campylobacter]MBE6430010.1 cupin domain-containing protein [Campylobacter sp.]
MEKVVFNFNIFDGVKTAMLCESEFSKEIRITMSKDAIMKEHRAPNAIIVQVLRGQIEFEMSGNIIVMNEFDMITLPSLVPHSLKALEDSIIRLSLSKLDSHTRVFKVANS